MKMKKEKLGVALVGLGRYSEGQLVPALKETRHCYLAGVVSGSEEKLTKWSNEHELKKWNLFTYDTFDEIIKNEDIDIVYIVLPNSMHADFVVRAAKARKHVICEKPMATTVEDCHRMISACAEAGVQLSVGYRLHFDPFNKEMMRLGQDQVFGPVKQVVSDHSMKVEKHEWRLDASLAGGGPLMDLGIYCVQAAIYVTGNLPLSVKAEFLPNTKPSLIKSVEAGIKWEMNFPGGQKAICESSYCKDGDMLKAEAANGWFKLEPGYQYNGLKGETSHAPMKLHPINQQAAQMDDFALCILNETESKVPGEMGLRDVEIMMAIYESAKTGKTIDLHLEAFANMIEV
jgi:predicted dehydrogenase